LEKENFAKLIVINRASQPQHIPTSATATSKVKVEYLLRERNKDDE